ncbi:MAG: HAD hydrolase-like protein [Telluria sp.]|nr:HAD hydrolase-like protein [Telluria sp.]
MDDGRLVFAAKGSSESVLERLGRVRGFVFDMDGTLVLGDERNHGLKPLPGALEITRWLTEHGISFTVFTNGTTRTPQDYAQVLRELGFALTDEAMMTPASSAVDLFVQRGYKRVIVLGGDGLAMPLRKAGIEVVAPVGKPQADAVLIGWYREFTMNNLEAACHAVWGGAKAYSASQAMFFATAAGRTLGTSRAISAMLKDLTGCRVQVIGKPSIYALGAAGRRLGVRLKELAIVGDDPELEVPMAHRGRSLAIAVNTGLGKHDSFAHLAPAQWPHLTVQGVDELLSLLQSQSVQGR